MKKVVVLMGFVALLVLAACGAPTVGDVAATCQQTGLTPGQVVSAGSQRYPCPYPTPTKVPDIWDHLTDTAKQVCQMQGVWFNPSTAKWLEANVGGLEREWHPDKENKVWVFEVSDNSYGRSTYGFKYPGFGVLTLSLSDGGTAEVVSRTNGALWKLFSRATFSC